MDAFVVGVMQLDDDAHPASQSGQRRRYGKPAEDALWISLVFVNGYGELGA
jgi:hypothetical protein